MSFIPGVQISKNINNIIEMHSCILLSTLHVQAKLGVVIR